ncbi:MAG: dTDP-4-amino-4,6-dideoxygalactose transaminase, partial [Microbacteriaceae bacterium]|nr:dTDP-4-amino-4,6-dideoxygalactose transaminase [Microbacteriaceae bacterium]
MEKSVIEFNLPDISQTDRVYLDEALVLGKSSGNGFFTGSVEHLLSQILDTKRALLTTSCTHALEMSALLCNLSPGDEVIV